MCVIRHSKKKDDIGWPNKLLYLTTRPILSFTVCFPCYKHHLHLVMQSGKGEKVEKKDRKNGVVGGSEDIRDKKLQAILLADSFTKSFRVLRYLSLSLSLSLPSFLCLSLMTLFAHLFVSCIFYSNLTILNAAHYMAMPKSASPTRKRTHAGICY